MSDPQHIKVHPKLWHASHIIQCLGFPKCRAGLQVLARGAGEAVGGKAAAQDALCRERSHTVGHSPGRCGTELLHGGMYSACTFILLAVPYRASLLQVEGTAALS